MVMGANSQKRWMMLDGFLFPWEHPQGIHGMEWYHQALEMTDLKSEVNDVCPSESI